MRNVTILAIGAALAFSAATAAAAPAVAKSDSSCNERYGYYGYSSAYCAHDLYGRSSPADVYYGQNPDRVRQDEALARLTERQEYSAQQSSSANRGSEMRDREDYPDKGDRDRG